MGLHWTREMAVCRRVVLGAPCLCGVAVYAAQAAGETRILARSRHHVKYSIIGGSMMARGCSPQWAIGLAWMMCHPTT